MMSFLKVLSTSASGMEAQSQRLRVVSENVANVDTPGYRRKLLSFREEVDARTDAAQVMAGKVRLDQRPNETRYDPQHPMADDAGYVSLSNVDLLTEIADAREAQRSYQANLNIFDQARRMYGDVLDLLRR